ncbi:MAG: hypothetical protein JWQ97_2114 [Phenylobacterium sp.]|nr:hypothetical protein [Phenylobacterium sp.]
MKSFPTPTRPSETRGVNDPRSTAAATAPRKPVLNDRRSTR